MGSTGFWREIPVIKTGSLKWQQPCNENRFFPVRIDLQGLGLQCSYTFYPPVDLHWFFEISIRTEKKNQLVNTEIFFSSNL